jgi:hypothetical protein
MGATLTEQRRVREDAFRGVNRFFRGRGEGRVMPVVGRYLRKKPRLTTCQQPR